MLHWLRSERAGSDWAGWEQNRGMEPVSKGKTISTSKQLKEFQGFIEKSGKRDSYADIGVLDSNQDLKFITTIHC